MVFTKAALSNLAGRDIKNREGCMLLLDEAGGCPEVRPVNPSQTCRLGTQMSLFFHSSKTKRAVIIIREWEWRDGDRLRTRIPVAEARVLLTEGADDFDRVSNSLFLVEIVNI